MARFTRRRSEAPDAESRRTGPSSEHRWWEPTDQAFAERPIIERRMLGPRWLDAPMINNVERLGPYGADDASTELEARRTARRPTALDEGRAWRDRDTRALVVARIEVFADADHQAHREAWQRLGPASLGATWRERWRERGHEPGWIEARLVDTGERPGPLHAFVEASPTGVAAAVDWYRVEDHTDPSGSGDVLLYQHLTVWAGRAQAVLVARHDLGQSADEALASAAAAAHRRLAELDEP